jgi:5-methylcytosine-specific restriction protein A
VRAVPEWIGKSDDTPVPARVKLRVLDLGDARCINCLRTITPGMAWECDHIIAIANGGMNRESNLQPLCLICHLHKTGEDVAAKSRTARIRIKHYGLKKPKGRPMPGTRASGIRKRMSGKIERW